MKSTIFSSPAQRARQRFQVMEAVLRQIGEEHSRLILMCCGGHPPADIARTLGLPEPQVRKQLLLAKQQFQRIIREHYS